MKTDNLLSKNRASLILLAAGIILAVALMSLPMYRFTASVYTKKSSNTFVGDEKYKEVRAEVEAEAEKFKDQGLDVEITETVTERTNSKGETTSLVAFSIQETFEKNIWSFIGGNVPSSHVLRIIAICAVLGLLCALAGSAGSLRQITRLLSGRDKKLRGAACLFFAADIALTPVFILMNNYIFWRKLGLYNAELITEGKEKFFADLDKLLFGGSMGDQIDTVLKNLSADHSRLVWVLMLCFLIAALAAVQLRFGAVRHTFLRALMYVFVAAVCIITLYPYYVMLVTAFRSNAETLDMYFLHLLPTKWMWGNLKDIVGRGVPGFLLNSGMVAGGATLLAMLCGIPAAFAMARIGANS